jgi:2,4-dienoyl-CoA reductase-like NADH-dependent reductase (Old Yellow Enzyme family)/thioredoxin reductase
VVFFWSYFSGEQNGNKLCQHSSEDKVGGLSFSKLLEPISIGSMRLKNRIVMPSLLTGCASPEGYVTERLKAFIEARARGGVGLIITEGSHVHPSGRAYSRVLSIADDRFVSGLSELARVIRRHGAKAAYQIQHCGRGTSSSVSGVRPVGPSQISNEMGEIIHELTVTEIEEMINSYAAAALRAKEAGFDGVEIGMGAEGLIGNFLSRTYNRRKDAYGGDLANRCRFMVEVTKAVGDAVGSNYPIWCRLDGKQDESIPNGITLEEAKDIARIAEQNGIQAIHLNCGSSGAPIPIVERPLSSPHLSHLAEEIRKVVTVPVIAAGAITPESGEEIIGAKKADLVAIGKGLVADPELPNKVTSGRLNEIRPCIKCLNCVNAVIYEARPIQCSVNAQVGREGECVLEPVKKSKSVLVVGGGPAGMEAARVAALRGHRVTLCERSSVLGGHLRVASVAPHKEGIAKLCQYLEGSLRQSNVKIRLGESVSREFVESVNIEAVIIAIGAEPIVPDIPGVECKNVVEAIEVLARHCEVGQTVVVVGGGLIGCETAEFLAGSGKLVTILEILPEIGSNVVAPLRLPMLARIQQAKIGLEMGIKVVAVMPRGVRARRNGQEILFEADTVVIAVGMRSNRALVAGLEGRPLETQHRIGDCKQPRRIVDAIREGFLAGCQV